VVQNAYEVVYGSLIDGARSPTNQPGDIDAINLYSTTYEWLVTFKDFCKRCDGFMVS
jgi:hypothetical protein